jgi:uncharacterized membrane protein YkoI
MRIRPLAALSGAILIATTALAAAYPGHQLARQAKVSIVQARAIALRAVGGTIKAEELEQEAHGSGLRYTFEIKTTKGVREVGVDAKTGAILENTADNG